MSKLTEMKKLLVMIGNSPTLAEGLIMANKIYTNSRAEKYPEYKATVAKLRLLGVEVIEK